MKLLYVFYLLVFLTLMQPAHAQNLVPDGSFEDIRRIQKGKTNPASCTKNWQCPMDKGGGDSYNKNGSGNGSAPRNIFGRQKPHSGNGYGGICIRKKFIEYLETKLSDTLIKDQEYLVEFYISKAERSIGSVKEFGALFSDKISMGIPGIGIPRQPDVENIKKHGYRKKIRWMKFSAVYKAKGGETVLILGYFNHQQVKRFKGFAHYYIDDVSVIPVNPKTKTEFADPTVETMPVVAEPINLPLLNQSITLNKIGFETNESKLLESSFAELNQLADQLKQLPNTSIAITGHTDNSGDEIYNMILSESRAKAVADYLINQGIDRQRISFKGVGSAQPVAGNHSEEGRKENRRVTILITK